MLQAKLRVIGGKHHGKTIPLGTSKFLIGREQDCQLRPNSELVSRHHCVFNLDDYTLRLRDLGSTNGTFLNDQRVRGEMTLKSGDRVRVGKLDFEIVIVDPETVGKSNGDSSKLLKAPPAELAETTSLSSSETSFEIPLPSELPDTGSSVHPMNGDTTVIGPLAPTTSAEQPAPNQSAPAGYPYPHDPYQQMPIHYPQQPIQYQQPYPWMQPMPYGPGGYPQQYGMPYQQPMYPSQMGMYPQAQPPYQAPSTSQTPADEMPVVPVKLPDPKSTGVRLAPTPNQEEIATEKSEAPQGEESKGSQSEDSKKQAKDAAPQANPSQKAADIIKNYMHRRPNI